VYLPPQPLLVLDGFCSKPRHPKYPAREQVLLHQYDPLRTIQRMRRPGRAANSLMHLPSVDKDFAAAAREGCHPHLPSPRPSPSIGKGRTGGCHLALGQDRQGELWISAMLMLLILVKIMQVAV